MALTLLLAKVFGIALIAIGIAIIVYRSHYAQIARDFLQQRLLRTVIAFSEMIVGLFIIIGHNVWNPPPAALITLFGLDVRAGGRELSAHAGEIYRALRQCREPSAVFYC